MTSTHLEAQNARLGHQNPPRRYDRIPRVVDRLTASCRQYSTAIHSTDTKHLLDTAHL